MVYAILKRVLLLMAIPAIGFASGIDNPGSSGASAGGSTGQIQYNAASAFAGLPSAVTASSVTISTPTAIKGSITNDSASVGYYGEYISSVTTAVPLANGAWTNVAAIALTPGDWDISGMVNTDPGPTTFADAPRFGLSAFSGGTNTDQAFGDNALYIGSPAVGTQTGGSIPAWRRSISANTTYYLKFYVDFTGGSPLLDGRISARRVR